MNKKFGKFKNGWHNVEIIYEDDEDDEIEGCLLEHCESDPN